MTPARPMPFNPTIILPPAALSSSFSSYSLFPSRAGLSFSPCPCSRAPSQMGHIVPSPTASPHQTWCLRVAFQTQVSLFNQQVPLPHEKLESIQLAHQEPGVSTMAQTCTEQWEQLDCTDNIQIKSPRSSQLSSCCACWPRVNFSMNLSSCSWLLGTTSSLHGSHWSRQLQQKTQPVFQSCFLS